MIITPEQKKISEIFPIEGELTYIIPIYQRNYSWSNANVEELLTDIEKEMSGYYVGNLLVTKSEENDTFNIVDGQQRITTIALVFLAINKLLEGMENLEKQQFKDIGATQNNIKRKLLLESGMSRLILLEKDAEVFKDHLEVFNDASENKFGRSVITKRYKFIYEWLNEKFSDLEEINNFYKKLNEVILLRITVSDLSDAFAVFSSLNAKGMPLTLIDLLKTEYLGTAVKDDIKEEQALESWEKLINIFSDSKNKEVNTTVVTQFLLNNYDAFEGRKTQSITKLQALKLYKDVFSRQGPEYISELVKNAKIFSHVILEIESSETITFSDDIEKLLYRLQKLDSSQTFPLILVILKRFEKGYIEEKVVIDVLEYLVNYYVRRNITMKPKSSNIRSKIITIVRDLNNSNWNNVLEMIKKELNKIASTNEEFDLSLSQGVYDIAASTVRFILIDLERLEGSYFNKQNLDSLDSYKKTKSGRELPIWTLEHILPEKDGQLRNGWSEMISSKDEDSKSVQMGSMHKLGNLTLTGYNSEMSDHSFVDKRDHKDENGNFVGLRTKLYINESIPDIKNGEKIESKISWTPDDIERRTIQLKEIVMDLYKI